MVSQGTGSSASSNDPNRGMPGDTSRTGEKTEQVREAAGQVKEQAAQMTDQVKEQTSKVTDKVREQATTRVDDQKVRAADGLVGFADALNQVSSSMRDQNPAVANFADTAATRLESFATTIRDKDVNELMNEVEDLARRQPALFIGGAFLAGVFAARFLKSSSGMSTGSNFQGGYRDRHSARYSDDDTRGFSSQYGSQYGRPAGGTSYSSTYGSTTGTTGRTDYGRTGYDTTRGSQRDTETGYRGGTTGGQDTPGAVRTGSGDVDSAGRGIGTTGSTTSGQTYSPYTTDETTRDRTRGTSDSTSSS